MRIIKCNINKNAHSLSESRWHEWTSRNTMGTVVTLYSFPFISQWLIINVFVQSIVLVCHTLRTWKSTVRPKLDWCLNDTNRSGHKRCIWNARWKSASWLATCDRIVENASLYQVKIENNVWDYTNWAFVEAVSLKATHNPFVCVCAQLKMS